MAMVEDLREAAAWLKTLTEETSELLRAEESNVPSNTPAAQLIAATADNPVFMSIVIRMMEEAANSLVEAVETSGALTQLLGMTGGGVHAPVIKIAQSVLEVKAKTTGSTK